MSITVALVDVQNILRPMYEAVTDNTEADAEDRVTRQTIAKIRSLLGMVHATHAVLALEGDGDNWRNGIYPGYKAGREPSPAAVKNATVNVIETFTRDGLPCVSVPDCESDDVIATLVTKLAPHGVNAVILSSDKDFYGYLTETIITYSPAAKEFRDSAWVEGKFGVPVTMFTELQALMGDKTDAIPGVDGIGPKKGAELLLKYGSLDAVIENAGEVPGKLGEKLRAGLDDLAISRQLVALRTDLELGFSLKDAALTR